MVNANANLSSGFTVRQAVRDLGGSLCAHTVRVAQDLDAWVEYDAGASLGHDCNDSWWQDLRRDTQNTALMKTVTGGLGSDFFHEFTLNIYAVQQAAPGVPERVCPWAAHLEMVVQDFYGQDDSKAIALVVLAIVDQPDKYYLKLVERSRASDTMLTTWENYQDRYMVIYKEGTKLIALAYQDAAHTILEDRAEITLTADHDFQYVSMPMVWGQAGAETSSGLVDPVFGSFEQLPCGFAVRREGSQNLGAKLEIPQSTFTDLRGGLFVGVDASEELYAHVDVSYDRIFGECWQRKVWFDGTYYWRAYYSIALDSFIFEYIHKTGLSGNVWTENANARVDASGFDASAIEADFSVRGAENGIPISLVYSDGRDVWVAESDEASVLGWAWENLTKVLDATAPDWYHYVALFGDRRTPINGLYVAAVYYDDAPGAVQYVRLSEQTTAGDITGWNAVEDVSNTANTNKILGVQGRSTGSTGPAKKEIIVIYKEGIALRSRYHRASAGWEAIQDIDTTTSNRKSKAGFDAEHYEELGLLDTHLIYIDADGSVRAAERDSGAAEVWGLFVTLDSSTAEHENVCISSAGVIQTFIWQDKHSIAYRQHLCNPERWIPGLGDPYNQFDPSTEAVVTTTAQPEQMQMADGLMAGDAVVISWIGVIAATSGIGWGILTPATIEDLAGEFIVRHSDNQSLVAGFNAAALNEELPGEFIVRHSASVNIPAGLVVRHPGSNDLGASFDGQVSLNIPAEFSVRRSWLEELPAEFVAAQGSQSLAAEFIVRPTGSANLLGTINVVHFLTLSGEFEVRSSSSEDLAAELIVRHPGAEDLAAAFSVFAGSSTDLLGGFISRQAIAPTEGVLIAYDPRALFNYEVDVGTGFTGGIKEGSDPVRKVAGEASMKVATRYEAKRNDYITFGWRYRYPEIPEQSRDLGASFVVNQLDFETWTNPAFSGAWYQAIAESFAQVNAESDHLEVGTFNPADSEDVIGGLWCFIGTMKKYLGCDVSFNVQFQDPYPTGASGGSSPSAGLSADRVPSAGGPNQILVYYEVASGEWHLNVGDSSGTTDVDLTGDVADFEARHLYRIIWETPSQYPATGRVRLYIDGALKQTITTNVPSLLQGFSCGATINLVGALLRPATKLYTFDDGT